MNKFKEIKGLLLDNHLHSDDDNLHQQVLNVGYAKWQKTEDKEFGYKEMLDWMEENFGQLAVVAVLLGKYNQQVCNGGHAQYYDNGYACNGGGCFENHGDEEELHTELVHLVETIVDIPSKTKLVNHLKKFKIVENCLTCDDCGGSGEYEEEDEEGEIIDSYNCDSCYGEGEVVEGYVVNNDEQLDNDWYAMNDQIMDEFLGFLEKSIA